MLTIDIDFYLKCLQRYPTLLLCGPVPNETHASDRWPTHSVHSGLWTSAHVGDTRRLKPQLTTAWASCVGAVSLVFLRSISYSSHRGTSGGLAHQRRACRDQEQVFRGQPGLLLLISSPSADSFALINCFE